MCLFFEEKSFSSFKIASLPNWEGAKYAGGNRPSCVYILEKLIWYFLHQLCFLYITNVYDWSEIKLQTGIEYQL